MINNQYQLYQESILALAETIVIKFEHAAAALNMDVLQKHGLTAVDEYNPASWKYYQNIAGQYHFSDAPIYVNSLDVQERITFTRANLAIHRATAKAYAYGSRYYEELVLQYPDQELLILGILYPADINEAINAPDGTILSYPSHLIEPWEEGFKKRLQDWIYGYLARWVVSGFGFTDDLYIASYMGQLYMHLVPAITNFRLEACKTPEVHSFHLQQYLASHGYLDRFLPYLLREQALWLYRNINYLQRHVGKRDTFDWVVQNILTKRNFPLHEYTMMHDVTELARPNSGAQATMMPAVTFKRKPLNHLARQNEALSFSLDYVLSKVVELAPGNADYHLYERDKMEQDFSYAKSAVVQTKTLESSITDYSNMVAYPLERVLQNHWFAWVCSGHYQANVILNIPNIGTSVRLSAPDALVLYLYALTRSMDQGILDLPAEFKPLERIPMLASHRVIRNPGLTFEEARNAFTRQYMPNQLIQDVVDTGVSTETLLSVDRFYDKGLEIFESSNKQYLYTAAQEHYMTRGETEALALRMYENRLGYIPGTQDPANPDQGILFSDWLETQRLDFSGYTPRQFYELAAHILSQATGMATRTPTSIGLIQRMMVELFVALSSYSIQVVRDTSLENTILIPRVSVRIGDFPQKEKTTYYVDSTLVRVQEILVKVKEVFEMPLMVGVMNPGPSTKEKSVISLDPSIEFTHLNIGRGEHYHDPSLQFSSEENIRELSAALTDLQRSYLPDAYGYNPDLRSGYVNQVDIGRVRYVGGARQVFPQVPTYLSVTLPEFIYTGGSKALPGFALISRREKLPGFQIIEPRRQIPGFQLMTNRVKINGFKWVHSDYYLPAPVYTGAARQVNGFVLMRTRVRVELQPFRTRVRIPGFSLYARKEHIAGFRPFNVQNRQTL